MGTLVSPDKGTLIQNRQGAQNMGDALRRATAFLQYARNFLEAATIVAENKPHHINVVVYYLYGHAIELALKSIIVKNCIIPEEKLAKEIGHDLCEALNRSHSCPEARFLDKKLVRIICELNSDYENKNLEYHRDPGEMALRPMHLPCLTDLTDLQESFETFIGKLHAKYQAEHKQLHPIRGNFR